MRIKEKIIKYIDNKNDLKEKEIIKRILNDNKIHFADIGAAGGLKTRWKKMSQFMHLYAFEPNTEIHEKLKNDLKKVASFEIIGKAIWDSEGEKDFYHNKGPNESSLMETNEDFVANYIGKKRFETEKTFKMLTTTIDKCIKEPIDAIKIDIQGGSYSALEGSERQLNNILTIELETEFYEIYKNQKTFFENFNYLTGKGFLFEDFTELHRWNRGKKSLIGGRLIYGDALFIKNPDLIDLNNELIFKKYFTLLFLYRKYDLCYYVYEKLKPSKKARYTKIIELLENLSKKAKNKEYLSKVFMRLIGTGASSKSIY